MFTIAIGLRIAGLSESGYHAWKRRQREPVSQRCRRHAELQQQVRIAFEAAGRRYGVRRVHAQLVRDNVNVSERTVATIFKELGLKSVHPAPWRCLTRRDTDWRSDDLIKRDFTASEPGRRFVGVITQIDTKAGPVYLATMIDLFNRETVGWAVADHHRVELVTDAVHMARRNGRTKRRAVFHSDRGSEYTSHTFRRTLKTCRMRQSMGRIGTCYDNAAAESFFATIKKECVHVTPLDNVEHARKVIVNYIEVWYNRRRLHPTIGYRSPVEAREQFEHTMVHN